MRPRTVGLLLFAVIGLSLAHGQAPLPSNHPEPITAAPIIPEKLPSPVLPLLTPGEQLAPAPLPPLTAPPPPPPSNVIQAGFHTSAAAAPAPPPKEPPPLPPLPPLQQQMHLSALRGADWLASMNDPLAHFWHGWVPALNAPWKAITICARPGPRSPWLGADAMPPRRTTSPGPSSRSWSCWNRRKKTPPIPR